MRKPRNSSFERRYEAEPGDIGDCPPISETLERRIWRATRRLRRSAKKAEKAMKAVKAAQRSTAGRSAIRPVTTIRFLISNTRNLELKTYYDVARLYPERQSIHIEFTKEEIANGNPAKRWLVVTI